MRRLLWIAIVASGFGWGTLAIGNRALLNRGIDVPTIAAYRAVLAAGALVIWLIIARRRFPSTVAQWRMALVMALGNMIFPFLALAAAVDYASAGFVSLIVSLITLSTALWSNFMLEDEPLSVGKIGGLVIAVFGVVVLVLSGDTGLVEGGNATIAAGFALATVVTIGFVRMYARKHAANYDADSMTAGQFTIGVAFLVPFAWVTTGFEEVPTGWDWGILFYIALVCTVLPFFLMFWLSKRASATQTSLSNYFVPLFGVTGGALVLGEQLQAGLLVAAPLIIGGALMVDSFETKARVQSTLSA